MVLLSHFIDSNVKPARVHLVTPHVPSFWHGFYAIFAPDSKNPDWRKYWFASRKGAKVKKAHAVISVDAAHKVNWSKFIY